jgi:CRISPR/Cas system-associated endonuclease/helicase Cas3
VDRYELVRDQLQNIDETAAPAADQLLQAATNGALSWGDVHVNNPSVYGNLVEPDRIGDRCYETLLRAWSTLVCADKLNAANILVPSGRTPRPDRDRLRKHVDELPRGETELTRQLNEIRSEAHDQAWQNLRTHHARGDRLFRLTLPTGFGKTLTGLRAALELAAERDGRVIYALPYTSVIDQVDGLCQNIFDLDTGDPAYTVHHHLADTRTDVEELRIGDHVSDGSETQFAETWQSGLVLTTFTQLFESVAGPGNTQSMKLPALQNSVIVVDEPQAISLSWWLLVSRLSGFLTREYDATIVLMTATQPRLLEQADELPTPTALTEVTERCFDFLESHPRVRFKLHRSLTNHLDQKPDDQLDLARAGMELRATTDPESSTLAIVNTVEAAATLTESVTEDGQTFRLADRLIRFHRRSNIDWDSGVDASEVAEEYLEFLADEYESNFDDSPLLLTLTTRLRPRDRRVLLATLRRLLDDETISPFDDHPLITISTQLIEAGVDVSFDRLYRDFAPLTAIVQAAGRCNRELDGDTGEVTIWRLSSPKDDGPVPSELIYGDHSLLRPTRQALRHLRTDESREGTEEISEAATISTGVREYYEALHDQRRTGARSDALVEAFNGADGTALRRASLIDQEYETQDIAVLVTDDDRDRYREYERHRDEKNWTEARAAFDRLKPLVVTVPVSTGDIVEDASALSVADLDDGGQYSVGTARGVHSHGSTYNLER